MRDLDGCIPIEDSPECQLAADTEEEPYDSFDCSSKQDGIYSIGCVNQFVNCLSGQAYHMILQFAKTTDTSRSASALPHSPIGPMDANSSCSACASGLKFSYANQRCD
ncbi:hypothetical protein L3Y34_016115 [Caenorhabditis briggsae]|uniref:Uncharacterized protein n=1 Tax=Caenorhabditis briggsae TaxID=6238 RepID=A0AAE9DXB2_CAEBR|nr:hypothetical protein L3Y34_016115 [Caenorhabditis briggsae]